MESDSSLRKLSSSRILLKPTSHVGAEALLSVSTSCHSGVLSKRGRRERLIERFNLPNKAFFNDIKKWRKRFVVISQGCVYIYDKNTSNNYNQAFSLAGYNKLSVLGSDSGDFPFRLEGRYNGMKEYHFSSATDEERKEWMAQIKSEMCVANGVEPESDDVDYHSIQRPVIAEEGEEYGEEYVEDTSDDSDYEHIPDLDVQPRSQMPLPPTPVDRRASDSSKSKTLPGMLKKTDVQVPVRRTATNVQSNEKKGQSTPNGPKKPAMTPNTGTKTQTTTTTEKKPPSGPGRERVVPKPAKPEEKRAVPKPEEKRAVPKPEEKRAEVKKPPVLKEKRTTPQPPDDLDDIVAPPVKKPQAKPKPPVKPAVNKPTKANNGVPKEKDYLFDSSNREEAIQKLKGGPPGTFLVRSSRTDEAKVLVVNTSDDVKEFKIFKKDGKVTLDKQTLYKSTQELIETYSKNNLPKRDITLGRAYSNLDLSAI